MINANRAVWRAAEWTPLLGAGLWYRRGPPKIDRADYVRDDFKPRLNAAILFHRSRLDPVYRGTRAPIFSFPLPSLLLFLFLRCFLSFFVRPLSSSVCSSRNESSVRETRNGSGPGSRVSRGSWYFFMDETICILILFVFERYSSSSS